MEITDPGVVRRLRRPASALKWYDWDQGLIRGLLLVGLAVIAGVPAALAAFRWRLQDRGRLKYEQIPWVGIAAVACVVLGFGYHLYVGVRTLGHSIAEHRVWLDQGEMSVRAVRLLPYGVNPCGKHTMLDPESYGYALRQLAAEPSCALSPTAPAFHNNYLVWILPVLGLWMLDRAYAEHVPPSIRRALKDAWQGHDAALALKLQLSPAP